MNRRTQDILIGIAILALAFIVAYFDISLMPLLTVIAIANIVLCILNIVLHEVNRRLACRNQELEAELGIER